MAVCKKCGKRNQKPKFHNEWARWKKWGWKLENFIRGQSTERDIGKNLQYTNHAKYRELKIRYLLSDWSLKINGEDDNEIKIEKYLKREEDGSLFETMKDESFDTITSIYELVDIIDAFLIKADLVLELGRKEDKEKEDEKEGGPKNLEKTI